MLPKILDIAEEHSLVMNPKTFGKKEVLCKCPFCLEDSKPNKKNKYYLSLNTNNQVFRCWSCGVSGGVFQFESKLTGITFHEIKKKYLGKRVKPVHDAERLNPSQLKVIGWNDIRMKDKEAFKKRQAEVIADWREYEYTEMVGLYAELTVIRFLPKSERQEQLLVNLKARCEETNIEKCFVRLIEEYQKEKGSRSEWAKEGNHLSGLSWIYCNQKNDKEYKSIVTCIPFLHSLWKIDRNQFKTK